MVARRDLVQILTSSEYVIKNLGKPYTVIHVNDRDINIRVENKLKKIELSKISLWALRYANCY